MLIFVKKSVEVATWAELKNDPEMVARLVPRIKLEHIFVVQIVEHAHLIHEFLFASALNRLHRHVLDRLLAAPLVDHRVLAPPNLLVYVIVVHLLIFDILIYKY